MLDVVQIVLQLLDRILFAVAVTVTDLRPPRDPWFDGVTQIVIRNILFQSFDEKRPLRPWPYKAHFTLEDVDHLRDLIDPDFSDNGTDARNPRIVFRSPDGSHF